MFDTPGHAGLTGRVIDAEGHGMPNFAVRSQLNFDLHNRRLASGSVSAASASGLFLRAR